MIKGAITNILTNNRQIEEIKNTTINARLSPEEKEIIIEISDDGPGFPKGGLKKVLGKSYQKAFEFGWSKRKGGTGFGLAESGVYIEEHDGTIRVDSEKGKGSTFTIRLPVLQENAEKTHLASKETVSGGRKEIILSLDVVGDYVGQPLASGEIKLPTNPGPGSHGTFEKPEEAPVVTLARQTGAPIMRTSLMDVPQLTDRRLSPLYGTADNGSGKSNEIEKSLIKECQQGIRFPYRREWIPHIKRNKRNIMRGVKGLKGGTAILLGAGGCISEPVKKLARKFDKVILVDLDEEGMQKAKEGLPKKLQEKIIIKREDIAGVSLDIMKEAKLIIEEKYSDDEEGAFNALRELLLKNSAIDAVILPELTASCDFVISSLVISELGHMPLSYIKKKVRKHFGDSSIKRFESPRWNEVENRFISAMEKAHARLLRNLVKDGGRVFVSSTTLEYNTESINLFDNSKFRTSGVERKIHYNDLRKILEENFIIKEEDAWDWVIRPSVKLVKIVILGLLYKVRSYILRPDKKFAIEEQGGDKLKALRLINTQI